MLRPLDKASRAPIPVAAALVAVVAAVVALVVGWAPPAVAGDEAAPPKLGRLEKEALVEALAATGLTVEPAPEGKTIGEIHIATQKVFSKRDWLFQIFNIFHRTTRAEMLRRELLMKPGEPYDQALVDESTRNLQAPPSITIAGRPFSPPELVSVVVLVPVRSARPGKVDLLLVTRDLWSLRFNSSFDFQQNTLAAASVSLSENNLFGWRKFLSVGFSLDLGRFGFGPTYFDPNVFGTRLTLYASAFVYYRRHDEMYVPGSGSYEGNSETFSFRYPLYALSRLWGAGVDVTHSDLVQRSFLGSQLRVVITPATNDEPDGTEISYIYRRRILTVEPNVVRSFRSVLPSSETVVIQRLTFGYRLDDRVSGPARDFLYQPGGDLGTFLDTYAPISERRSEPYLRYEIFTARYTVIRDLDTFDLRENFRLGPSLTVAVAYGMKALGADRTALGFGGTASFVAQPAGGLARLSLQLSARWLGGGQLVDQLAKAQIYLASPLFRFVRLVLSGEADVVRNDTFRTRFALGGSTGLRGYAIGDRLGSSMMIGHAELRSAPLAVWSQRVGAVLFYDVGDATDSYSQLVAYQDAGVGLRWLIPQLNSSVLRVDWAVALRSSYDERMDGSFVLVTRAGFPGRFTAGYEQIF